MDNIYDKITRKIRDYLFIKYAFPPVINENISKARLKKYLKVSPNIIDCGAHVGTDSIELAKLFKTSNIYAFEPIAEIFSLLKKNIRKVKRIQCYNLAIGNRDGEALMHVSSGTSDGSSSLLKPKEHLTDHPNVLFLESIQVQTITLDSWARKNNIKHIDLLWLDMQGFELEALKVSPDILKTVKVIHMEVSTRATYEGVPLYEEVQQWMKSQGFRVEIEAIPPGWDMGNVLFVREKEDV